MAERPRLGELLVRAGVIDTAQLGAALREQRKWGSPLGMIIVRMGVIDEETLVRTLARQLNLPLAWLRGKRISSKVLAMLPGELAQKHRCLPLSMHGEGAGRTLFLAMQDPVDRLALDEIRAHAGCTVKAVLAAPTELEDALRQHYPLAAAGREGRAPGHESSRALQDQDEPELLWFDREIQRLEAHGESAYELGEDRPGSEASALVGALAALVDTLIEKGALSREELLERLAGSGRGF
jgi:hypothetical protein